MNVLEHQPKFAVNDAVLWNSETVTVIRVQDALITTEATGLTRIWSYVVRDQAGGEFEVSENALCHTMRTMITTSVPVWSWNGYNSRWVESNLTRDEVAARVAEDKQREGFDSATVIEDGEYLTMITVNSREFYGQRVETQIYTTRRGAFVPDEQDNLQGDWMME